MAPLSDGNSEIAGLAFSDLRARQRPYLTPGPATVDNPRVIPQDSFWASVIHLSDELGVDAWALALAATITSTIAAVYVFRLRRRFEIAQARLKTLETLVAKQAGDHSAPPLNVFCQQLMNALGMELPSAVSGRMSPDDPARFIRALAIYTRAQRRRLVALYRQAESLREALHPGEESAGDSCIAGGHRLRSLVPIETEPPSPHNSQRNGERSLELQLVR